MIKVFHDTRSLNLIFFKQFNLFCDFTSCSNFPFFDFESYLCRTLWIVLNILVSLDGIQGFLFKIKLLLGWTLQTAADLFNNWLIKYFWKIIRLDNILKINSKQKQGVCPSFDLSFNVLKREPTVIWQNATDFAQPWMFFFYFAIKYKF